MTHGTHDSCTVLTAVLVLVPCTVPHAHYSAEEDGEAITFLQKDQRIILGRKRPRKTLLER